MRESDIETYLTEQVAKSGGLVRKVQWIGRRGAPDRLVGWPGRHALVEVKTPGAKARPEQAREHERLRAIGFLVVVVDTFEAVDLLIEGMA